MDTHQTFYGYTPDVFMDKHQTYLWKHTRLIYVYTPELFTDKHQTHLITHQTYLW